MGVSQIKEFNQVALILELKNCLMTTALQSDFNGTIKYSSTKRSIELELVASNWPTHFFAGCSSNPLVAITQKILLCAQHKM